MNKRLFLKIYLFYSLLFINSVFAVEPKLTSALTNYCQKIEKEFARYKWGESFCSQYDWHHVRNSVKGTPLIWTHFGDESYMKRPDKNITMIMCGVHGDEITPIKFCFDIIALLKSNDELSKNKLIVIAPIVNPDSFFIKKPTRTNSRGIDVNRNFPTEDFKTLAIKLWKQQYRSDKRRFPGAKPLSEPEVIFQVNLIKLYGPNKIISVHAPLTLLDYDGPEDLKKEHKGSSKGYELLIQMSQKASDYSVRKFPFYPGSLGNWAGQERKIPTYTIELPSSDPAQSEGYWKLFKDSIIHAINQDLTSEAKAETLNEAIAPAEEKK